MAANSHTTRRRGRIKEWRDDRGFGFITPVAGGRQTFVHISAFANRGRRPKENDVVTYLLGTDERGRPRAVQVEWIGGGGSDAAGHRSVVRTLVVATSFLVLLGIAVISDVYPATVLLLYVLASVIAFVMYWYDKSAARTSRWRTAENTLHAIDVLGGWPGALVAMQVFRHKSSKASFRTVFWMTVVLNCAALVWLATPYGSKAVTSIFGGA